MDWHDLLTAFALYLVLEGIAPFMNPSASKRLMARMSQMADSSLRLSGAACMLAGAGLLYFVR